MRPELITHNSQLTTHNSRNNLLLNNMENKNNIWSKILKIVITVLTAIATTFGLQACGAL